MSASEEPLDCEVRVLPRSEACRLHLEYVHSLPRFPSGKARTP
jgi:hypothetical protein